MANYINVVGSQTVTGTSTQDQFFAFTRLANLDYVRPDAVLASLVWDTAILTASGGAYQVAAIDIQISSDLFLGDLGTDILYGSNLNDAIVYNNGVVSGGFGSFDNVEQFWLADGNDLIDLLAHSPGGLDYAKGVLVQGGQGNDAIIGGAGKDNLQGDSGNDTIFGWRGSDTITGGVGDDVVYGDDLGFNNISGDDIIDGGAGDDLLSGKRGKDRLTGGDGNDVLHGGGGEDNLTDGAGNDTLYGDDDNLSGGDMLDGNGGDDLLYGGLSGDEMYGSWGNDVLDGGVGKDYLNGGGGSDTLLGGAGDDLIDGAGDTDTLVLSGTRMDYAITLQPDGSYLVVDQRSGLPDGTDTIRNIEFFQFADTTVASNDLIV